MNYKASYLFLEICLWVRKWSQIDILPNSYGCHHYSCSSLHIQNLLAPAHTERRCFVPYLMTVISVHHKPIWLDVINIILIIKRFKRLILILIITIIWQFQNPEILLVCLVPLARDLKAYLPWSQGINAYFGTQLFRYTDQLLSVFSIFCWQCSRECCF